MKIANLNRLFLRLGKFQLKNRIGILISLLLFTLIAMVGLNWFEANENEEAWFSGSKRERELIDAYKEKFGNSDGIYVLVEAENIFDYDVLCGIKKLCDRLEVEVPYAKNLDSILRSEVAIGTEDEIKIKNPYEDGIPEDPVKLKEIQDFFLSRKSYVDKLFTSDCRQTIVCLNFEQFDSGDNDLCVEISKKAVNVVKSEEFKSEKYKFYPAGDVYNYAPMLETTETNALLSIVLGTIVMIVCLFIFLRSVKYVLVTLVSTILALIAVFGLSGWFRLIANESLLTIPVILGMALSVGYSIHMINCFTSCFNKTGNRKESVLECFKETFWPLLFTVLTTFASLISFFFAETKPVQWLGGCSAAVVVFVFLYVIILVPIALSFGKDKKISEENKSSTKKESAFFTDFGKNVLAKKRIIIAVSAVLLVVMIFGITKVRISQTDREVYGEKMYYIKDSLHVMDSKIGSGSSVEVMLCFPEYDSVKTYDVLSRIEEFTKRISAVDNVKSVNGKYNVSSVLDIIKELNQVLNEDNSEYYSIPESDDLISELFFVYEISGGKDLFEWIDEDFKTTHVSIAFESDDTMRCLYALENFKSIASEIFPDAEFNLIGNMVSYTYANSRLVWSSIKSFGFSFIIIMIMIIIAFSGIWIGLIGMIPNLAPVIIVAGIIGYLNFSLDMYTMTVLPIILGIAVDDTIHFLNHIKMYYEDGSDYENAIIHSFQDIGKSMLMTTLILCAMFIMYVINPIQAIYRIGLLTVIGLAVALVADYTITPVIVYLTKPWGGRKIK